MKKPDEIRFYNVLRAAHANTAASPGLADAYFAAAEIHPARGYMCLEKWDRAGWWEYGVSLRAGWFTEKAPPSLTAGTER